MNIYTAKYFSHGEWRWIEYEILAESEEQVRRLIDEECAPEWRDRPYKLAGAPYEDTLQITLDRTIELPYIMRSY